MLALCFQDSRNSITAVVIFLEEACNSIQQALHPTAYIPWISTRSGYHNARENKLAGSETHVGEVLVSMLMLILSNNSWHIRVTVSSAVLIIASCLHQLIYLTCFGTVWYSRCVLLVIRLWACNIHPGFLPNSVTLAIREVAHQNMVVAVLESQIALYSRKLLQ